MKTPIEILSNDDTWENNNKTDIRHFVNELIKEYEIMDLLVEEEEDLREFKKGEEIQVRRDENDKWDIRTFVAKHKDSYICEVLPNTRHTKHWKYAQAIKKPEYIPFTFDTFPRGIVYLREYWAKVIQPECLVSCIKESGIEACDFSQNYNELLDNWEISTDLGKTWQPAGELK